MSLVLVLVNCHWPDRDLVAGPTVLHKFFPNEKKWEKQ